jgi:hypothetical protein
MSNPWQQVFESYREQVEETYIAEKYGQHTSDESEETQALYDLRNKMKNMGKDAVVAYLKRSKMTPERKARLARSLGVGISEEFTTEGIAGVIRGGLAAGTALAGMAVANKARQVADKMSAQNKEKETQIRKILGKEDIDFDGETIEEKITSKTDMGVAIKDFEASSSKQLAGRSKEERRKAAIAAVLTARRGGKKLGEEVEDIQEDSKILVRVTKEDGSVFQKKIPSTQLADYRKRYKTVVVVGGSEQSKTGVSSQGTSHQNESSEYIEEKGDGNLANNYPPYGKVTRGDVIAGALNQDQQGGKKKKSTRKESYSDWKTELPDIIEATKAQKSVEGRGHAGAEDGEKKKRKEKSNESECDCSYEVKESAELLARELGGELVEINLGSVAKFATKETERIIPKLHISTEPAGKLVAKASKANVIKPNPLSTAIVVRKPGSTAIAKVKPKSTAIAKVKPKTTAIAKVKPKTTTKTKTTTLVKLDNKTGAISQVEPNINKKSSTNTSTSSKSNIPPKGTDGMGPGGRGTKSLPGGIPGGGGLRLPIILPKLKPNLPDPVPQAQQFKV